MPQFKYESDPLGSLRGFLSLLDEEGNLLHITRKVRQPFELAAIVQNVQRTVNKAILFENVEGFQGKVASNLFGSHRNIKQMLYSTSDSLADAWVKRCEGFRAFDYTVLSEKPGGLKEAQLSDLPSLVFHEKDGGPYITGGIVLAKHPGTGRINLSFHRVLLTGTDELIIRLVPSGHLFLNQRICETQGRSLECAILIGTSPLLMLAATATLSHTESELDLASHLLGRAWPLCRCKTVNLDIPADTEIVLEGEILPNTRRMEGPFGEWMGYYTIPEPNHVFKVKAVFSRENPVYYGFVTGSPDDIALLGIPTAGSVLKAIRMWVPHV
jgi:4-hydroxybenzoate decarboxylase